MELPEWHDLVKVHCVCSSIMATTINNSYPQTGCFKEMCPMDPDWYYTRAASIARKVYLRGGTGVGAFSKVSLVYYYFNDSE